jgi:Zn-dependent protease with chaperone function
MLLTFSINNIILENIDVFLWNFMKNNLIKLFTFTLLLCISSLHAMDKQERDYSVCNQIKQLLPALSPEGRLARINEQAAQSIIDQLQEQGITVCDCIKQLSKQKNEKALKPLSWLTEEQRIELVCKPKPAEQSGNVSCDSTINPKLCEFVRQHYQRKEDLIVTSDDKYDIDDTLAYAKNISPEQNCIYLHPKKSKWYTHSMLRGVLAHEVTHLNYQHPEKTLNLLVYTSHSRTSEASEFVGNLPMALKILGKVSIAREAEADRVSACISLQTAKDLERIYRWSHLANRIISQLFFINPRLKEWLLKKAEITSAPTTFLELEKCCQERENPTLRHPTTSKRYQWATTILRLREEEKRRLQQQQNMAQQSESQQKVQTQAAFRQELMNCL